MIMLLSCLGREMKEMEKGIEVKKVKKEEKEREVKEVEVMIWKRVEKKVKMRMNKVENEGEKR